MSEPKRYTDLQVWEALHFSGSTSGWICWEDYARLKAEVGELCEAIKLASEVGIKMADEVTRLKAENERLRASSFVTAVPSEDYEKLKAEIKRLRKAGDEVVSRIQVCTEDLWCSIHRWNAAKEGRPNE